MEKMFFKFFSRPKGEEFKPPGLYTTIDSIAKASKLFHKHLIVVDIKNIVSRRKLFLQRIFRVLIFSPTLVTVKLAYHNRLESALFEIFNNEKQTFKLELYTTPRTKAGALALRLALAPKAVYDTRISQNLRFLSNSRVMRKDVFKRLAATHILTQSPMNFISVTTNQVGHQIFHDYNMVEILCKKYDIGLYDYDLQKFEAGIKLGVILNKSSK